jgi:glycosyltransferase involved in cell wall biosynthesis
MSGWTIAAGLSLAYWCALSALAALAARRIPRTRDLPPVEGSRSLPLLSLVVPARDEEDEIADALRSKLTTRYPDLELVAVDDRSRDRTGQLMVEVAASDPRVRVVHVRELPEGWLGKLHAMARGLDAAGGEWVLFSDADVHLDGDVLERIVAHAERERLDFVGVMPGVDHEATLLDAVMVNFIRMITLLGRMWLANDDRSRIGIGVGAFNLVRRAALERTPGLGHLRMEIADDVALGAMVKACGGRARLFAGRGDVHLRFYASLGSVARSWEKFGTAFEFSLWRPTLFFGALLALELGLPIAGLARGGPAAVLGGLALGLGTLTHAIVARHFGLPTRGVIGWAVGLVVAVGLLMRGAFVTRAAQAITWRGTTYPRDVLLAGRRFVAGRIDLGPASTRRATSSPERSRRPLS